MTTAVCTCVVLVLFTYRSFFPCRYDTGGAHSQRLLFFRGVTIPGSTNAFPYIPLHSEQTLRFKTRRRSLLFTPSPLRQQRCKSLFVCFPLLSPPFDVSSARYNFCFPISSSSFFFPQGDFAPTKLFPRSSWDRGRMHNNMTLYFPSFEAE